MTSKAGIVFPAFTLTPCLPIKISMPKTKFLPDLTNGYPQYAKGDDIYARSEHLPNIDPEDPTQNKTPNEKTPNGVTNEKNFSEDVSGSDLDVPGNEDDNSLLKTGIEDEENNFYSLGGDVHENLEEDKGE